MTLLLLLVVLIILLFLYPCRCFHLRLLPLHAFVDAFQGCYKDGTNGTRDCRYFAGLQLVLRLLFPFIFLIARETLLSLFSFAVVLGLYIINPRRACAARVTVVGSVCLCVCVSVCLLSHISPMERLFVLKTLSRTQRATKVKKFVGFSLKPLRCRDPALPPLYGHAYSRPFFHAYRVRACVLLMYTRTSHVYAHDTPRTAEGSAL